jgi:hypothetical protein
MNKRDVIILLGVLAAALCVWGGMALFNGGGEYAVIVYVDGKEYARAPLKDGIITVEQEDGSLNVVEITSKGVRMQSANCKNQVCVHQGWITLDDKSLSGLSSHIVCLPNGVSVALTGGAE